MRRKKKTKKIKEKKSGRNLITLVPRPRHRTEYKCLSPLFLQVMWSTSLLSPISDPPLFFSPFYPFFPLFFFTTNLNDTSFFIFNFPFSTTTAKKEDLQTQKQLWIFSTKLTLTQIPNTHTHTHREWEWEKHITMIISKLMGTP